MKNNDRVLSGKPSNRRKLFISLQNLRRVGYGLSTFLRTIIEYVNALSLTERSALDVELNSKNGKRNDLALQYLNNYLRILK